MAVIQRLGLVFTGAVQGVGFRYRAVHAARLWGCTGFCRNLWDGSVEMEIQGSPEQIDRVLQAVEAGRYIHIEHISRRQLPLLEGERDFRTDGSHSF